VVVLWIVLAVLVVATVVIVGFVATRTRRGPRFDAPPRPGVDYPAPTDQTRSGGVGTVEPTTTPPVPTEPPPVDVPVDDLAPDADVLRLTVDGARVVVRPSGTEPKLKAYLEVVDPSGSQDAAAAQLAELRDEVTHLVR